MHIIGIKIEEGCDPKIIKNLKPGWYPFGDYDEPTRDNGYKWRNGNPLSDRLYQMYPNMPRISVSCVIGMNGSGKTTLFDILFRIINNLASYIKVSQDFDRYAIEHVKGLNAKLYFVVDGNIGCINNHEDTTDLLHRINSDGNLNQIESNSFSEITKELFYTIGVNYSLYSMNYRDDDGINKGENKWMCNIYNNEAEYEIPLSFTPYRTDGQIDIQEEEKKANRRLITLSLLLHSQGKELINCYKPTQLNYSINTVFLKNMKDKVVSLAIRRKLYNSIDDIINKFREKWEKTIKIDSMHKERANDIYSFLAYEAARICLTYKSYRDSFDIESIINAEDRDEKDSASKGKYKEIIERLIDYSNKSSITSDIHQLLVFLSRQSIEQESGSEQIDSFINRNRPKNKKHFNTYSEIYDFLPPAFYDVDLFFSKGDDSEHLIPLSQLSSGEKQLLFSHSSILYHIYNIANAKEETGINPYKHINIIIDEVELYSHPEFQRMYLAKFIDMLAGLHIDNTVIRSINVIIATHSPFIITDIPIENILCLENGSRKKVDHETYCANIYDLLKQSFFLNYPMGEIARRRLNDIVLAYNNIEEKSPMKEKIQEDASFYRYIGNIIAEPIIRKSINVMVNSLIDEERDGLSDLLRQKEQLKEQMNNIDEQIKKMYEEDRI